MIYPAMTYIGSNHFSALYGQNDTIIDQKATGLQHLFVDNFEKDLIHTACSTVRVDDTLYYADRIKAKIGHPRRHQSSKSYTLNNAIMVDEFVYDDFTKVDYVGAHEKYIRFKTIITNTSNQSKSFKISSLMISKPGNSVNCELKDGLLNYKIEGKHLGVMSSEYNKSHISLDAPSGFMYHGVEDLLFDLSSHEQYSLKANNPISSSLYVTKDISPHDSYSFEWVILIGKDQKEIEDSSKQFRFIPDFKDIKIYWENYLNNLSLPVIFEEEVKTKLVALKGALLQGLLPADITGHYFANGEVSFYSRDALMGSRAFLYAGLYEDFESIIAFFLSCEVKDNGEYFQRYRFDKCGDEGANNNVFRQIDFIGYFIRVITDYYELTNKLLCSFDKLENIIDILSRTSKKHGLYGPEGGVNEGVYGPAFITSTNMFIAGGIKGAIYLAKAFKKYELEKKWTKLYDDLFLAIEQMYNDDQYYPYGYVTYHDQVIRRYDTPQLLSISLGYPVTSKFKQAFKTLLSKATFFGYGFGYSEQEYHDGPWIFNTAAAAEVAYIINDHEAYDHIMNWLVDHQNGFGLNPEAIDAKNENIPFINPLMWANSEFVCAAYVNRIKMLRKKYDY
ncbi:MAG: hypothetical protein RBQ71_04175 [Acholeplasmataceae bacterium]|jgi:hypothetical protein|nr:hypothetical protein [Acholeplasmataceae bacterium]